MFITVKRKDFETLNDVSLIWTCIEPAILQARGKSFTIKSEVFANLTAGQRALFMFQVLYGHISKGVEEFYSHLSYLLSNKGVWLQLIEGMKYFRDYDMVKILEKMDLVFKEIAQQHNALIVSIDKNTELSASMSLINRSLSDTLPSTIKLVATYIRDNTDEFVEVVD